MATTTIFGFFTVADGTVINAPSNCRASYALYKSSTYMADLQSSVPTLIRSYLHPGAIPLINNTSIFLYGNICSPVGQPYMIEAINMFQYPVNSGDVMYGEVPAFAPRVCILGHVAGNVETTYDGIQIFNIQSAAWVRDQPQATSFIVTFENTIRWKKTSSLNADVYTSSNLSIELSGGLRMDIGKFIGRGINGGARIGHDSEGNLCAIKMSENGVILRRETIVYCSMQNVLGFPKVKGSGIVLNMHYLALQFVGYDLMTIYARQRAMFTANAKCIISAQMLTRVESLHQAGYLHGDIKPSNFCLTLDDGQIPVVYMIDFGSATPVLVQDLLHDSTFIQQVVHRTSVFQSIHMHQGQGASRRDDIECLAYTIMALSDKGVPWMALRENNKKIHRGKSKPSRKPQTVSPSGCFILTVGKPRCFLSQFSFLLLSLSQTTQSDKFFYFLSRMISSEDILAMNNAFSEAASLMNFLVPNGEADNINLPDLPAFSFTVVGSEEHEYSFMVSSMLGPQLKKSITLNDFVASLNIALDKATFWRGMTIISSIVAHPQYDIDYLNELFHDTACLENKQMRAPLSLPFVNFGHAKCHLLITPPDSLFDGSHHAIQSLGNAFTALEREADQQGLIAGVMPMTISTGYVGNGTSNGCFNKEILSQPIVSLGDEGNCVVQQAIDDNDHSLVHESQHILLNSSNLFGMEMGYIGGHDIHDNIGTAPSSLSITAIPDYSLPATVGVIPITLSSAIQLSASVTGDGFHLSSTTTNADIVSHSVVGVTCHLELVNEDLAMGPIKRTLHSGKYKTDYNMMVSKQPNLVKVFKMSIDANTASKKDLSLVIERVEGKFVHPSYLEWLKAAQALSLIASCTESQAPLDKVNKNYTKLGKKEIIHGMAYLLNVEYDFGAEGFSHEPLKVIAHWASILPHLITPSEPELYAIYNSVQANSVYNQIVQAVYRDNKLKRPLDLFDTLFSTQLSK
ncbi:hypothetical protein M422DRAFT_270377 [Sphaerobolus stellatus SS14]|uniref:non-specific serine/threonine protein kinase n=1 Tax=Sphaerobolus stellatus (strain SS14) TaxID=990650 RepID=A0A0C9USS1_SPHS4|nr:hypothetical protein M422DRAFT_270377 [Sphaerobolus stellatus SS14]